MAEMLVQCKVLGSVELEFEVTVVSLADVESGNLTMKNLRELVGKQLEEHDQHNDFRMICNGDLFFKLSSTYFHLKSVR